MVIVAKQNKRQKNGDRNAVLIETLYDGCLRISECLSLRPIDIQRTDQRISALRHGQRSPAWTLCHFTGNRGDLKSFILDYPHSRW